MNLTIRLRICQGILRREVLSAVVPFILSTALLFDAASQSTAFRPINKPGRSFNPLTSVSKRNTHLVIRKEQSTGNILDWAVPKSQTPFRDIWDNGPYILPDTLRSSGQPHYFNSSRDCHDLSTSEVCTQYCYSLPSEAGGTTRYACMPLETINRRYIRSRALQAVQIDRNGTLLHQTRGSAPPVRGGLLMVLVEDSPELNKQRLSTAVSRLLQRLEAGFQAMNIGLEKSGQPMRYGSIAFGKATTEASMSSISMGNVSLDSNTILSFLETLTGHQHSAPTGSLLDELGMAVDAAMAVLQSENLSGCQILVVSYSVKALLVPTGMDISDHPLLHLSEQCDVHLMGAINMLSATNSSVFGVHRSDPRSAITAQIRANAVQYEWAKGSMYQVANLRHPSMSLIRRAMSLGASIWDSGRMLIPALTPYLVDATALVVAYGVNKQMARLCFCHKPVTITNGLLPSDACRCSVGTIELPTPALVINTGTPALPNSLPRILAGQSFNMSCRNLLRTSSSYNSVLAASVEWSVLPPKAVVNTPSRPSSSISFFLAHPEPGRYCARCRSVDFAGITRSRLCFEVVIDATCQKMREEYRPEPVRRADIVVAIGRVDIRRYNLDIGTFVSLIDVVLQAEGIGSAYSDSEQNGFYLVYQQFFSTPRSEAIPLDNNSVSVTFLLPPLLYVNYNYFYSERKPLPPSVGMEVVEYSLDKIQFRPNSHRVLIFVSDDAQNIVAINRFETKRRTWGSRFSNSQVLFIAIGDTPFSKIQGISPFGISGSGYAYLPSGSFYRELEANTKNLLDHAQSATLPPQVALDQNSSAWDISFIMDARRLGAFAYAFTEDIAYAILMWPSNCEACTCSHDGQIACGTKTEGILCSCILHLKLISEETACSTTAAIAAETASSGVSGATAVLVSLLCVGCIFGLLAAVIGRCLLRPYWLRHKARMAEKAEKLHALYNITDAVEGMALMMMTVGHPIEVLPSHRLELFGQLSSGHYGCVFKGVLREGKDKYHTVAIKRLKPSNDTEMEQAALLEEYLLQKKIGDHPNVVRMLAGGMYKGSPCLVMEFMENGDLLSFLRHKRHANSPQDSDDEFYHSDFIKSSLSSIDLMQIALQAAHGLNFLSSQKIVHRDVAARNILVHGYEDGNIPLVKISDLGLARYLLNEDMYLAQSNLALPVKWMAIESLEPGIFSTQSDVWSFGVLLWEIVTLGSAPYPGLPMNSILSHLVSGKRLLKPRHCSDEVYKVMMDCWNYEPSARPSFNALASKLEGIIERSADYIQVFSPVPTVRALQDSSSHASVTTTHSAQRRPLGSTSHHDCLDMPMEDSEGGMLEEMAVVARQQQQINIVRRTSPSGHGLSMRYTAVPGLSRGRHRQSRLESSESSSAI